VSTLPLETTHRKIADTGGASLYGDLDDDGCPDFYLGTDSPEG